MIIKYRVALQYLQLRLSRVMPPFPSEAHVRMALPFSEVPWQVLTSSLPYLGVCKRS